MNKSLVLAALIAAAALAACGKKEEPAPAPAPAPAAAPAPEAAKEASAPAPTASGHECPYGHTFGKNWAEKGDCRTCEKSHKAIEAACEAAA